MIRATLMSFRHALRGLRSVWREERNFRIHCAAAVTVLLAAAFFGLTLLETALIVFAIAIVLGAEILNTVIEDAYDTLHPQHRPLVGRIKDMLAGLVLLNAAGAVVIGILVFGHHFWALPA